MLEVKSPLQQQQQAPGATVPVKSEAEVKKE
jgi:hypothetical protein